MASQTSAIFCYGNLFSRGEVQFPSVWDIAPALGIQNIPGQVCLLGELNNCIVSSSRSTWSLLHVAMVTTNWGNSPITACSGDSTFLSQRSTYC